ncbi:MAG: transposase [bacterium]|nr:transposase [bacterium]
MVERRVRGSGSERAFFYGKKGENGRLESIPVEWTDMAAQDPFVVLSAGQAYFLVEDLLQLSALIESLSTPSP